MRWLTLILVALIALLQYSLWLGKGSWLKVWELDQQLQAQRESNISLQARNASMDAEVRDLKQGFDAIEERARSELGLVKRDEVFFQVLEDPKLHPLHVPVSTTPPKPNINPTDKVTPPAPALAHPTP
jgi:cell division protein FtsB